MKRTGNIHKNTSMSFSAPDKTTSPGIEGAVKSEKPRKVSRVVRIAEVVKMTGLSKSTIYNKIKNGTFPTSFRLGKRAMGWMEHEIQAWILACSESGNQEENGER